MKYDYQSFSFQNKIIQDVIDHLKRLDYAEREVQPVRLEYVKLKRQLEATEEKYLKMTRSQHEGLDQNQITIDNRVINYYPINILYISNKLSF